MNEEFAGRLNDFYRGPEYRWMQVYRALDHRVFTLKSEYRSRHSYFDDQRSRVSDDYPLPYIEVKGICEFQIEPDALSCFSCLSKEKSDILSSPDFDSYSFDVWGGEDRYTLLYRSSQEDKPIRERLAGTDEMEFIVHFRLPKDMSETAIYNFAKLLRKRGFRI